MASPFQPNAEYMLLSEVNPEDSASNISTSNRSRTPSKTSTTSSLQSARVKEIQLATDREKVKRSNEMKDRKRLLQRRLDEQRDRRYGT